MSLVPDDTAIVRPMRGALKCLALSLVLIPLGYRHDRYSRCSVLTLCIAKSDN